MNGINPVVWAFGNTQLAAHQVRMFDSRAAEPLPRSRAAVETTLSRAHFYASASTSTESPLDAAAYHSARARASEIRESYTREWKAQVLNKEAEVSANALTRTLRPVMRALAELGPGAIDLTNLPQGSVNGRHLAVVLRATFRRQEMTPGWENALQVARFALSYDGFDEKTVLSGLIGR